MVLKKYPYDDYGCAALRVIDDTDCACEGDDPFAVAHLLITSKFDVRAVTAENYLHQADSAEKSYAAVGRLAEAMGLAGQVNILHGSLPMADRDHYQTSEASRFIVEEALRDDRRPLFVVCQGALTNLAVALRECPEIAGRITCIWIGGAPYPAGGWEFNLCNDITAARIVFESGMELWQVPANVYSMMRVSFMTLYKNLSRCGRAGRYLCEQLWSFNRKMCDYHDGKPSPFGGAARAAFVPSATGLTTFGCGECWQLGDSPVVGLMLNCQPHDRDEIGAPAIADDGTYRLQPDNPRRIYVYRTIDAPFILEDFFDKMAYQFGE